MTPTRPGGHPTTSVDPGKARASRSSRELRVARCEAPRPFAACGAAATSGSGLASMRSGCLAVLAASGVWAVCRLFTVEGVAGGGGSVAG